MKKDKKIAIIGHFGGSKNILDGQTIKTKILFSELELATDWKIKTVDTYYKKIKPIKLLFDTIVALISTKDVIVLLSGNGMKFYFPLLYFFAKVFRKRIYHDVIGGNLDSYVKRYPRFKDYLNSFVVNWVETASLSDKLEVLGISNCEVIPNFKRLNIVRNIDVEYTVPYRFCIFSRVMKEKGIELAIEAINAINEEAGITLCTLDIYGRIDESYQLRFEELMENRSNAIEYKGVVPYDKSVDAIKKYYALLFPTFWQGEGFPGTIVDAFSAGIPVLASDWNCNKEIVHNKINGVLYPSEEIKDLKDAIEWLINHRENMRSMKKKCIECAEKYQPTEHINKIVDTIRGELCR